MEQSQANKWKKENINFALTVSNETIEFFHRIISTAESIYPWKIQSNEYFLSHISLNNEINYVALITELDETI